MEITFDPSVKAHREAYCYFLNTGRWKLRFKVELPHRSVPTTVEAKLMRYALRNEQLEYQIEVARAQAEAEAEREQREAADVQYALTAAASV